MRICIIDDNTLLADALGFSLRDQGHEVDLAPDGPAGIAAIEASVHDAVLIDWQMPGMRGDEVAGEVRKRRPDAAILIMSGGSAREDIAGMRAARAAADHFIEKPFTPSQLLSAIRQACELRSARG